MSKEKIKKLLFSNNVSDILIGLMLCKDYKFEDFKDLDLYSSYRDGLTPEISVDSPKNHAYNLNHVYIHINSSLFIYKGKKDEYEYL